MSTSKFKNKNYAQQRNQQHANDHLFCSLVRWITGEVNILYHNFSLKKHFSSELAACFKQNRANNRLSKCIRRWLLFSRSVMSNSATLWTAACQASLCFTISQSLLKLMSTESVMPSNHLILCCPLLLLPSIFLSIKVFSSESILHIRWPEYWSFSFIISHSNKYSGLISFRMDWLDLLAVQGTLKGLLQHHSSKVSILWGSAFFIVQLSHPYMTTGKTIVLTRLTFVGQVMSLLFNMLSRLVIFQGASIF